MGGRGRGGFRGRGRGGARGGGPGGGLSHLQLAVLKEAPKAIGVLYPPADAAYIAPPDDLEDLILRFSTELDDVLRDGYGLPYTPPLALRTRAEEAAELKQSSSSKSSRRDKGKKKSNGIAKANGNGNGDMDVDMEDLVGEGSGPAHLHAHAHAHAHVHGTGTTLEGQGISAPHYAYAGGVEAGQEVFKGWRIPDSRKTVGIEVDDLDDRPSRWNSQSSALRAAATSDKLDQGALFLDKDYFPPGLWEAHYDDTNRTRKGKRKREEIKDDELDRMDDQDLDEQAERDSNASSRADEGSQFGDDEEMDHGDYDQNYFDDGEGDDDDGGGDDGEGGDF